jgi:hypothetical protein
MYLQLENVEITEAVIEPQFLGATGISDRHARFYAELRFSDHPVNTSRGWVINMSLDADAIAGDGRVRQGTARLSYYHPIGKSMLSGARCPRGPDLSAIGSAH